MKHKKLKTSAVFLLLGFGGLQAQEAIPATGGNASGTGGTTSYSVGQVVYTTNTGTNGTVTQGVQQSYEISTVLGVELTPINLVLSVYPNPTTDYLTLQVEEGGLSAKEGLTFQLYNMEGKLLEHKKVVSENTTIKMAGLRTATYFLMVINNQSTVKTFRIIKN